MYATLLESRSLAAALALAERDSNGDPSARLPLLEDQVCAEAGLWAPDAARVALVQAGGDPARAVALVRVWAAALPQLAGFPVRTVDVALVRRFSAIFPDVPGGQWLGPSPEFASRLLVWDDDDVPSRPVDDGQPSEESSDDDRVALPTRAGCPRVRDLLRDVPVRPVDDEGDGPDPSLAPVTSPFSRTGFLALAARGETGALVGAAALALTRRREAVLAEVTTGLVGLRLAHPRTEQPCVVARVPIVEAEAVLDADVAGRAGFALGWGASLGTVQRRAIALSVIDGALQADAGAETAGLDAEMAITMTDGLSTAGFVDHLRLPHYASFASYLARVRSATGVEARMHDGNAA